MKIPNVITLVRLACLAPFLFFLYSARERAYYIAAGIFLFAFILDFLDGYVARKTKTVTDVGKFLDPLVDKIFVCVALVALVDIREIAGWMAAIILIREFAISGLRTFAALKGAMFPADKLAKLKTNLQVIAVLFVLLLPSKLILYGWPLAHYLLLVAVIITVVSGIEYFWKGRTLFREI